MQFKIINSSFKYDGSQLRSLYAYLEHRVQGNSIVTWVGPCEVTLDHMVDGEDYLQDAKIAGGSMAHFVVEVFAATLREMVTLQRLLTSITQEVVFERTGKFLRREGDDLYLGSAKFSISIATLSPVSGLIHFAVNCTNEGTPVETCALSDLQVEPSVLQRELCNRFSTEFLSIQQATCKVKWVK